MQPTANDIIQRIDLANTQLVTVNNLLNSANSIIDVAEFTAIRFFLEQLIIHLKDMFFIKAIEEINLLIGNGDTSFNKFTGFDTNGKQIPFDRLRLIYESIVVPNNTTLDFLVPQVLLYTEISEAVHSRIINEIKATLTPTANIDTLIGHYKNAIQNAFGVTFSVEIVGSDSADEWNLVSLHFARLGFEATAKAFGQAIVQLAPTLTTYVNRYDLFQRIMGNMEFQNKFIDATNVAQTFQRQIGARIEVYRNASENRQRVMTPNNLIHELGHAFDGRAGIGFKKIGSIEQTVRDTNSRDDNSDNIPDNSLPLTRESMGPTYLQVQFYEHARIVNNNGTVIFDRAPLGNKTPTTATASDYLMGDVFGTDYSHWQRSEYIDLYGTNARIDTFVHNDDETETETVADAFLSWVRGSFDNSDTGINWISFFNNNIGIFIRNAVIYSYSSGSLQYYIDKGLVSEASQVRQVSTVPPLPQIRLVPEIKDSTNLGVAYNPNDPSNDNDLQVTRIYGWATNENYDWFAIEDANLRLVWIVDAGLNFVVEDKASARKILTPLDLSPDRSFNSNDLNTILGL